MFAVNSERIDVLCMYPFFQGLEHIPAHRQDEGSTRTRRHLSDHMKTSSSSRPHPLLRLPASRMVGNVYSFDSNLYQHLWPPHPTDGLYCTYIRGPKGRDRCSKWYLGHVRPSLALCEGETDVNELLSLWLVEQHSPKLPHLSPSSSSELGIQTVAGGSGLLRDVLEEWLICDDNPDALIFCLAPHASLWGLKYPHVPATLLITVWTPIRKIFWLRSLRSAAL